MAKSNFVEGLDLVQAEVFSLLKPLGFNKNGRTHNRNSTEGLTHVVNFQKSKYLGEHPLFPWFWRRGYGKFAMNLGVHLPCVSAAEDASPTPNAVMEYQCSIRTRLGSLTHRYDKWYEITDDNAGLAARIVVAMRSHGLKFLNEFQSYQDVLTHYQRVGYLPGQGAGRSHLEAALVANQIGDKSLAQSLFQKACVSHHQGFRKHAAEVAKRVGYAVD